ncbi:hypothetical protein AB0E01_17060 [Nocardia vinacea]|uniref:hypothetical protein n=1 Tax=Nocardia vinacea TaxID=96468 RepID=UPI0033E4CB37
MTTRTLTAPESLSFREGGVSRESALLGTEPVNGFGTGLGQAEGDVRQAIAFSAMSDCPHSRCMHGSSAQLSVRLALLHGASDFISLHFISLPVRVQ